MRVLLLTLGATIALVLTAACGNSEEDTAALQPATATAAAPSKPPVSSLTPAPSVIPAGEPTLWRWVNVTVLIPADSDVSVTTEGLVPEQKPPNGGLAVSIVRDTVPNDGDKRSEVLIDAETGATLLDEVLDEDRAAIDRILQTMSLGALDRAIAAWPYNGEPPGDLSREVFDGISYLIPTPETGLRIYQTINDPGGPGVAMTDGRSSAGVYLNVGTRLLLQDTSHVLSDDLEIFQRWLDTAKVCELETTC